MAALPNVFHHFARPRIYLILWLLLSIYLLLFSNFILSVFFSHLVLALSNSTFQSQCSVWLLKNGKIFLLNIYEEIFDLAVKSKSIPAVCWSGCALRLCCRLEWVLEIDSCGRWIIDRKLFSSGQKAFSENTETSIRDAYNALNNLTTTATSVGLP